MASTPHTRIRVATGLVALIPVLAACSSTEEQGPDPTAPASTTASSTSSVSAAPTTATSSTTATTDATAQVTPSTTAGSAEPTATGADETSTSTQKAEKLSKDIEEIYEVFQTLAPRTLFEQFDTCDPNGVENSSACTGAEVGQFQFFANNAKAASTTQLLTELRSSRVVEDTGSRIVGWTTMGTMSIITVVDNDEGLVLQQMVSSDRIDPEERIYELRLVEPPEGWEPSPTSTVETSISKD
ncbi:hypothetical protein [uncultured Corynebacterium sp.]|uniref:hypothetical protein n=1 Tax=uncultured Corynebacterium sp. TaxID=159447 RepID=UPI0025E1D46D|nr:hypothetical protein [uncultured Corynebacterium sp.]